MANPAQVQYNGMILLHSYLQRMYVYENTKLILNFNGQPDVLTEVKGFMEEVNLMVTMFEDTKMMATTQYKRLFVITTRIEALLKDYFIDNEYDFSYQVALVASALYGERAMNSHVIRLGKIFDVEVSADFERRIKFYEERTKAINAVVHILKNGEELPQKMIETIRLWFDGVDKQRETVIKDADKIKPMLSYGLQ